MTAGERNWVDAEIASLYAQGYGVQQIANRLGMTKAAVLKVVHRL